MNSPQKKPAIKTIYKSGRSNILIAYFSWSGNNRHIADQIHKMTDAACFEIKPVKPYASNYTDVLDQAKQEKKAGASPELANHVDNISQYDTIILGYPNWWGSIPMPIASFLDEYDFTGKTIIPFCSHGGGGIGRSLSDIAEFAPDATLGQSLSVRYSGGRNLSDEIQKWLYQNGLTPK